MEKQLEEFEKKTAALKEARLQLLKLHKLLVDIERENYEKQNCQITSGQFLHLLINDSNFSWLRKFSTLIVEIDEMLDLDDGYTENMIEEQLSQMRNLLSLKNGDDDFYTKYQNILQGNSEVSGKHGELKILLD
ncbi:MAG: hypothetical protein M3Q33_10470 [Acidobacteriota bacterium]|nr:hypothetical protein [Acidobacteriota bacterium]